MNLNQEINVIINLFKNRKFGKVLVICERLLKKRIFNTQIYNFYGLAFQNLRKQEDEFGFKEAPIVKNQKFFFLGPKNNWKNIINKEIQKKIDENFEKEMKELGYL